MAFTAASIEKEYVLPAPLFFAAAGFRCGAAFLSCVLATGKHAKGHTAQVRAPSTRHTCFIESDARLSASFPGSLQSSGTRETNMQVTSSKGRRPVLLRLPGPTAGGAAVGTSSARRAGRTVVAQWSVIFSLSSNAGTPASAATVSIPCSTLANTTFSPSNACCGPGPVCNMECAL